MTYNTLAFYIKDEEGFFRLIRPLLLMGGLICMRRERTGNATVSIL